MNGTPCLLAPLALSLPCAAQQVWVVDDDGGPGVDHMQLQQAVDAANSGDIILVRDGSYIGDLILLPPVAIDAKGLSIFGEGVVETPLFDVDYVPAGAHVVLRGLDLPGGGVWATSNAGVLWLEDVTTPPYEFPGSNAPVRVTDCGSVIVQHCEFRGFTAHYIFAATPAISALDSRLFVHDSVLSGGWALTTPSISIPGSPALQVTDSFAFLYGTDLSGGLSTAFPEILDAHQAGDSTSITLESPADWLVEGGTQTSLAGPARTFEASAITREGQNATFDFDGPSGELAILNVSLAPVPAYLPGLASAGLITHPLSWLQLAGPIPPSGGLSLAIPVPSFAPGFEGIVLFAQSSFGDPVTGQIHAGPGSAILLLDASL